MTHVFIENVRNSGKTLEVIEDFGDYAVHHDLAPGQQARIGMGRLKSLRINEIMLSALARSAAPAKDPAPF